MIRLSRAAGGVLVPVHVQPRASKDRLVGDHGGALKVAVTAPPEGGRANEAVSELLAEALGIAKSRVTLLTGTTSRAKTLHLAGLSPTELLARLRAAAPGAEFSLA